MSTNFRLLSLVGPRAQARRIAHMCLHGMLVWQGHTL